MTTMPELEPVAGRPGGTRLLAPTLVLAAVAAAIAWSLAGEAILGGSPRPTASGPPLASGRILVGLPTRDGAVAHLLRDGLEVEGSPRAVAGGRGCPTLLRNADGIAVHDRWRGFRFESFDGSARSEWLSTNYAGYERWSPDHGALAMVDVDRRASIVTFPDPDPARPAVTGYPIVGRTQGILSAGGGRMAMPVSDGANLAIHLLDGGTDTVVGSIPTTGADGLVLGLWSADARQLLLFSRSPTDVRLSIVRPDERSVRRIGLPDGLPSGAVLVPMAWAPNGMHTAVASETGAAWILDTMRGDWRPLPTSIAPWETLVGWSPDGELGIVSGRTLRIHRADGTFDRSIPLPGTVATWSPDGSTIASLVNDGRSPVGVWATDAWGQGGSRQVATLHPPDPIDRAIPDMTCIQWQPEVTP